MYGSGVGHAVVADGYGFDASTPYHHLNLGWAGTGDAWYNLPSVGKFDVVYYCLYNIFPNSTGEIISGRVLDAQANPLEGVTVTATRNEGDSFTGTTNARGIYALAPIPSASTYHFQVAKEGYTFISRTLTINTSANNLLTTGNRWGMDFSEPIPLARALDNYRLTFITSDTAPWYGQTATAHYGGGAAQSGSIANNQTSALETTVVGPGELTFYWKVSSEKNYDYLKFYVDSSLKASISGTVNWAQQIITVPRGSHKLKWIYTKNSIESRSLDCGWVDKVVFNRAGGISPILILLLSD
ncbi:MAG: carboxypeptidase regulatory-like domain-containing protein [Desulfobacterales bacterium]|nr:carboxypeptidase regulatory-like domain-containing protein [Desulfobacterales bacterium]